MPKGYAGCPGMLGGEQWEGLLTNPVEAEVTSGFTAVWASLRIFLASVSQSVERGNCSLSEFTSMMI